MSRKLPLVVVEYLDITGRTPWVDKSQLDQDHALTCRLVGWKYKQTKDELILVSHVGVDSDDYADRHVIPRGCIRSIRQLE